MKKILINHNAWQTRVAVLRDKKLQDIYLDSGNKIELERCFFKGKVAKILPGIQTAFVDIGQEKAGFLHITEVDRALAVEKTIEFNKEANFDSNADEIERKIKKEMDISKIFSENEDILVQVSKEPIYGKGAKLTTCFTLPGRLIVLMPNIPQIGISKKIENKVERQRLREILIKNLPKGMGVVIRTTAENRDEKEIKKDLAFLISIWKSIIKKFKKAAVGDKVFEDLPITLRVIRDHLDNDVEAVLTDNLEDQKRLYRFVRDTTTEHAYKIKFYDGESPLFEIFDVEKQIEKALQKKVLLKSGGSLIIETTEAMSVVDVNTGRFIGKNNLEDTIFKTNIEAAEEIVTQLRLRNIGGLIVIDFIDMSNSSNRQKLSKFFEKTLKEMDKFQTVALKISEFGLVQMTRKRSGKTLVQQLTKVCECCNSYGFVKSTQTISYEVLQLFKDSVKRENHHGTATLVTSPVVFDYLTEKEYKSILKLEKEINCKIILESNDNFEGSLFKIEKS
ncbi:TPA: Rne/Rng family ribonuclease [Candidatus Dependentiae bacterium]|nr:MAG: cytoplasmic axial filament protein (Ribonuclease G) [candidate division TM6 bacterium GW2011_GWE2_31_21]KKP53838.1 MAG: cytoplasmic axial filament protein (Ribonuclease G) [candidate division TM6 bacterium GW2011_GWF2_33_332]HBS47618.1 Rne/Rng family ribonuclease [Candidatus Dependentiae bacterium]HBZ73767.1 Rne/Rng family ribonuclease [Candidatus Dependentiae bacterium]